MINFHSPIRNKGELKGVSFSFHDMPANQKPDLAKKYVINTIYIHLYPSISIYIYQYPIIHVHPSTHPSINPYPSTSIHIHPSTRPPNRPPTRPPVRPSIHPSIFSTMKLCWSKFCGHRCHSYIRNIWFDLNDCFRAPFHSFILYLYDYRAIMRHAFRKTSMHLKMKWVTAYINLHSPLEQLVAFASLSNRK